MKLNPRIKFLLKKGARSLVWFAIILMDAERIYRINKINEKQRVLKPFLIKMKT